MAAGRARFLQLAKITIRFIHKTLPIPGVRQQKKRRPLRAAFSV
jgi:hypothetical protein